MHKYPLILMGGLAVLSWAVSILCPNLLASGTTVNIVGWVLLSCGMLLVIVTGGQFLLKETTWNPAKGPSRLVTTGLYSSSRNPMYIGMLLTLTGFQLVLGSLLGLLFSLYYFLYLNMKIIPNEERIAENLFGEEYRQYRSRTRRWI